MYEPLIGATGPGLAYVAARRLVLKGAAQPNGYTEPLLHGDRRSKKADAPLAIADNAAPSRVSRAPVN